MSFTHLKKHSSRKLIMPSCAFPTCRKSYTSKTKEAGFTFHRFPTDEVRRLQWISILQKARIDPYWKPGMGSTICSKHFDETCFYVTKGGYRKIKMEAYPTKGIAMYVEEEEVCAEMEAVLNPHASVMNRQQPAASSQAGTEMRGTDDMSDLIVFGTPMEARLRRKLELKEKVCKRQMNIIKSLRQRNRRLVKKNEMLKNTLKSKPKSSIPKY